MKPLNWETYLREFSRDMLTRDANEEEGPLLPEELHAAGYLGRPGATEDRIAAAEARLGVRLPPSYRAFLEASDGWADLGASYPGKLRSVNEIEWLSVRNQDTIDLWGLEDDPPVSVEEHWQTQGKTSVEYHGPFMRNALEISDWGDACILFLCPDVVTAEGEWECWKLASWLPGAGRDASFQEWMVNRHDGACDLLRNAVAAGDVDRTRLLLERGVRVEAAEGFAEPPTALFAAAARGDATLVTLLLEYGADPLLKCCENPVGSDPARWEYMTPLAKAESLGHTEAARRLRLAASLQI